MAWPSRPSIWGSELAGVQRDIAAIAQAIAAYEPVVMCAHPSALESARTACGATVRCIDSIPVDDCWMRDSGPVFSVDGTGGLAAVGLNFNGWGGKQEHRDDARVAARVAALAGTPFHRGALVCEGGAIESDGDGTLLATESSIINANRNPGIGKARIERAMCAAYGAQKVVWLRGIRGKDITDDHVDATSRFVRPGVVVVQVPPAERSDIWARDERRQARTLASATDAHGRRLRVIRITGPSMVRSTSPDFVDSYVNYYVANGAVIAPEFGDVAADASAKAALARSFPGRVVEQVKIDHLAAGGGGIHCVTQQQPRP